MTSKQDFIELIGGLAKKYPSPFFNSVTIAQAILESGWGTSDLAVQANNLFGIKASAPWSGDVHRVWTVEEDKKGNTYEVQAYFRKYKDIEESIRDHASFIISTEHRKNIYDKVIHASNPKEQARALTGTYATDSHYGNKLIYIIENYKLERFDIMTTAKAPLKIIKEFLPLTKTFGHTGKPIGITLHQTGAPQSWADARGIANYQKQMSNPSNGEQKSWHYQVDDKLAIQSFPHTVGCWHASDGSGTGNMKTVAIESCINSGADYAKTMDNTAKLMAWICYLEGFNPLKDIKRHYDYAPDKKWCPAQIMNGKGGYTFTKLIQMTIAELNKLRGAMSDLNPQNLPTEALAKFEPPKMPYKQHKTGEVVTLADDFRWYDYNANKLLKSKRHDELKGTKDKVVEVKTIDPVGTSRMMYKLDKYNSWILEEHLKESYLHWKLIDKENNEASKDGEVLKDGQFRWNGKLYEIKELK